MVTNANNNVGLLKMSANGTLKADFEKMSLIKLIGRK